MKRVLVVGGAGGIGLGIATELALAPGTECVYIVDKNCVPEEYLLPKMQSVQFDLQGDDYSLFDSYMDVDGLVITAGFGHIGLFRDVTEDYIVSSFNVNAVAAMRIIRRFYPLIESRKDFYCGVMVSIAGFMSSPFFSVYAATKAALKIFIESVNVELLKAGTSNRILNVSPGSIRGTGFDNGKQNLEMVRPLAREIIDNLLSKNDLFIPDYDNVFRHVLERYHADFRAEGTHSYEYKVKSGRVKI